MLVKSFVWERRKKMTKSDFFGSLLLSSHVLKGTFASIFYELPGSIILSGCIRVAYWILVNLTSGGSWSLGGIPTNLYLSIYRNCAIVEAWLPFMMCRICILRTLQSGSSSRWHAQLVANLFVARDLEIVPYRTPQRPRLHARLTRTRHFKTRGTSREVRLRIYLDNSYTCWDIRIFEYCAIRFSTNCVCQGIA